MASVLPRGKYWRAMVRRKREKVQQTFDTEGAAREWADKEEARILAGLPAATPTSQSGVLTVADLFDRYAKEVTPDKRGFHVELIRLRKLASAPTFRIEATALDSPTMARWRDKRLKEVSPGTVNRELGLIGAVMTRAIKEWGLPLLANPISNIQRPRRPHARERRVPDNERAAILAALGWSDDVPETIKQWVGWGFAFALETMVRYGEMADLTWQHVHLDRKFCHLPQTKNGYARNVPLSTKAVALLRLIPERQGAQKVLPTNYATFLRTFREAVRAAGVEDLHFHDTRREAITRASKKITNIAELARATGHRDTRSLMIYYQPDVTDIADKLG